MLKIEKNDKNNEILKQLFEATTMVELFKFLEVEKHYPKLSNEEKALITHWARLKMQSLINRENIILHQNNN